jgi:hypothetical protein
MTLEFTVDGEVKIIMIPYVKEIVQQFKEHMKNLNQLLLHLQLNICSKSMTTLHPLLNDNFSQLCRYVSISY